MKNNFEANYIPQLLDGRKIHEPQESDWLCDREIVKTKGMQL